MNNLAEVFIIGIGATIMMGLWGILRTLLFGTPPPNYKMVGRWLAHMAYGTLHHKSISASAPIQGEQIIGWTAHYLIGVMFAVLMAIVAGTGWLANPTVGPALLVDLGTVAAPFLLMQLGMGAGIASSKTQKPNTARLHSLINHAVFGLGLYATAKAITLYFQYKNSL